jgi:hypothetical protein
MSTQHCRFFDPRKLVNADSPDRSDNDSDSKSHGLNSTTARRPDNPRAANRVDDTSLGERDDTPSGNIGDSRSKVGMREVHLEGA